MFMYEHWESDHHGMLYVYMRVMMFMYEDWDHDDHGTLYVYTHV